MVVYNSTVELILCHEYDFYLLFVRTHTKFGIKILELTW